MFKLVRDGVIRNQATNYLKTFSYEKRLLATNQEVVSWADVVIIGKSFFMNVLFGDLLIESSLLRSTSWNI